MVEIGRFRIANREYDSPWKEMLENFLRSFLEFCFGDVASAIDWSKGFEFLDKELQEITRDAALGEQRVDKLVKVSRKDGSEEWILIHLEVQHQRDATLPERVYQYHHRVRDRFGKKVVTLVILADDQPDWKPNHFEEEELDCRIRFEFPICKLLECVQRAKGMLEIGEPSAVMIVANWATEQTRKNMEERRRWKWELTRALYETKLGKKDILELYRLLDW